MNYDLQTCLRIGEFHEEIKRELLVTASYENVKKDILIVVHNQLAYLEPCIQSIIEGTKDYRILVWDNASDEETRNWLIDRKRAGVVDVLVRSEENLGFIIPNNELAKLAESPYAILLNSDTIVFPDWDKALVAHLQNGYDQVGYIGGHLNENGKGERFGYGDDADYIPGWCFGVSRQTLQKFGPFDSENLHFAYCEDADFSLRLKEAGGKIRALHLGLVFHHQNKTIIEVSKKLNCRKSFEDNHLYLVNRWKLG